MAQESYADYSIIHKYLEQQSLHEEELQRYKDNIRDLSESLQAASWTRPRSRAAPCRASARRCNRS